MRVGGYSRIKSKADEIRVTTPNTMLLNMGDEFQVRELRFIAHRIIDPLS